MLVNNMRKVALSFVAALILSSGVALAGAPPPGALGGGKHPVCVAWVRSGAKAPPPKCEVVVSSGIGGGFGACVGEECRGTGATTLGGESGSALGDLGLGILGQVVQQVLGQLLQQALGGAGSGSGGSGSSGAPGSYANPDPNPIDRGVTDAINQALNDEEAFTDTEDEFTDLGTNEGSSAKTILDSVFREDESGSNTISQDTVSEGGVVDTDADIRGVVSTGGVQKTGGEQGTNEPRVVPDSPQNNTGSFYGAAVSVQDETVLGRLCSSRPWANSFVTSIIPASFFDSLCVSRGYVPGGGQAPIAPIPNTNTARAEETAVARAAAVRERGMTCPEAVREGALATIAFSCAPEELDRAFGFNASGLRSGTFTVKLAKETQYGIQCTDGFADSCRIQVVHPQLTIWAEPESVRLGARTVVYWNAEDVEDGSCVVKGPSFSETGAQGGASTVPINTRSVYMFTCTGLDGAPLSETLTIDLAL